MGTISIGAIGDVMMGVCSASTTRYEALLPVRIRRKEVDVGQVGKMMTANDINLANLEGPVVRNVSYRSGEKNLVGPVEGLSVLEALGINVVSLANNHIIDYGEGPIHETKALLKQQGISCLDSPRLGSMSHFSKEKGWRVCIIGYGAKPYFNVETDSLDPDYYRNWEYFRDAIRDAPSDVSVDGLSRNNIFPLMDEVRRARSMADLVLVYIHWGFANTYMPSPIQIEIGHRLIDLGVDGVIGHHPHVIQPVEIYRGRPIAYSLGNFLFDSWKPEKIRSMALRLKCSDGRVEPEYYISRHNGDFRYRIDEAEMIDRETPFMDEYLEFRVPKVIEKEVMRAENVLGSYYRYARYRDRCRRSSLFSEVCSLLRADCSVRTKGAVILRYLAKQ